MSELALDYSACLALDREDWQEAYDVEKKKDKPSSDRIIDAKEAIAKINKEMIRCG